MEKKLLGSLRTFVNGVKSNLFFYERALNKRSRNSYRTGELVATVRLSDDVDRIVAEMEFKPTIVIRYKNMIELIWGFERIVKFENIQGFIEFHQKFIKYLNDYSQNKVNFVGHFKFDKVDEIRIKKTKDKRNEVLYESDGNFSDFIIDKFSDEVIVINADRHRNDSFFTVAIHY